MKLLTTIKTPLRALAGILLFSFAVNAASDTCRQMQSGALTSVAYSPKGDTLAFGGLNTVSLATPTTLQCQKRIAGYAGRVTALAFSPDGSLLFAGGGVAGVSGEIRVTDLKGNVKYRLKGASDMILGLAVSASGKRVVGGSYDHNVYVWDLKQQPKPFQPMDLAPARELKDHTDAVYAADITPDGMTAVSASGDRTVKVWDLKTGKRRFTLPDSTGDLFATAIRPDASEVAAAGMDRIIRIWSLTTGQLLRTAFAHDAGILALRYTHNGKRLISSGEDRTIKIWDATTLADAGSSALRKRAIADWPQAVAVDPKDRSVVAGCQNGDAMLLALPAELANQASSTPGIEENASLATCGLGAVGPDAEVMETPEAKNRRIGQKVTLPCVVKGSLDNALPGDPARYYRFHAARGEKVMAVVNARRSGSPLDSYLQILEPDGRPVERAVIRSVAQTEITLFDRDAISPGIRLLLFPDLQQNDYVMIGRELLQVGSLAKGVDDDTQFRSYRGQRQGQLGTTPEYHTIGSKVYRVEVHPAGSVFPPNGMPLVHLNYENDDGGPLYGRDSVIDFTAPHDGDYLVRITDTQNRTGNQYSFKLELHAPRPDYSVSINPAVITVPAGSSVPVTIGIERFEEFTGPVNVKLTGLPPGIHATETTIQALETSAVVMVSADPGALTASGKMVPARYRLETSATAEGTMVAHNLEMDDARKVAVGALPVIEVSSPTSKVTVRSGGRAMIHVAIKRLKGYMGRVPVDVLNLPAGMRVADVGLNGILIPEGQTERDIVLDCPVNTPAQERWIGVQFNAEGGQGCALPPMVLTVLKP